MQERAFWRFTVNQSKRINDVLNEDPGHGDGWQRSFGAPVGPNRRQLRDL